MTMERENMTTQDLIDIANNAYVYETEHVDAADTYSVLWENVDWNSPEHDYQCEFRTESPYKGIEQTPFDDQPEVVDYVYLGQEEMEIQLPREVQTVDEQEALDWEGFTCKPGSDLVYAMFPDNLFVVLVDK